MYLFSMTVSTFFKNYSYAKRLRRTLFSKEEKGFNFYHKVWEGEMKALVKGSIYHPTYLSWKNFPHT